MLPLQLFRTGVHQASDQAIRERAEAYQLQLTRAASLSDLSELVFYSPAAMLTVIPWGQIDPMATCLAETGLPPPLSLNFEHAVLTGFPGRFRSWEYSLHACEQEHWQTIQNWVGTVAVRDPASHALYRVRWQPAWLPDPLFLARAAVLPDKLPRVKVYLAIVESPQGLWYYADAKAPWAPLRLTLWPALTHQDVQLFGDALAAEHENPYRFVEEQLSGTLTLAQEQELWARVAAARAPQDLDNGHSDSDAASGTS